MEEAGQYACFLDLGVCVVESVKVYSYLRFSDPRQALGTSAERQIRYAVSWAAERGITLDESLTFKDEGLSAYHQHHIKQGALGAFLLALADGRIPIGAARTVCLALAAQASIPCGKSSLDGRPAMRMTPRRTLLPWLAD